MMRALQAAVRAQGIRDPHDDTLYRTWLQARTGKTSATECSDAQLKRLLNELNGKTRVRPTTSRERYLAKIDAQLAAAGRTRTYLEGGESPLVKRIAGVDALEFADEEGLRKLVAALTYDANRRQARAG
jgi:phage gp16-like protein